MDILCVETGKVFYEVDETFGVILCEGLPNAFRRAVKRNAQVHFGAPNTPQWKVGTSARNNTAFCIEVKFGRQTNNFFGKPDEAYPAFKSLGFEVPDEIIEQYRTLVNGVNTRAA